jgi:integrase/recombinase XerD
MTSAWQPDLRDNHCYLSIVTKNEPDAPQRDLAIIDPDRFTLAWVGQQARVAYSLTEVWLAGFKSEHTRKCYRRDLTAWLAWCAQCRVSPADARIAHIDSWIAGQREHQAAEASIARRVHAISSWYSYLIDNTAQDAEPIATFNPAAASRKTPKIDPDFSPTIGLTRAEADRLISAADADCSMSSALVRLLLVNGLRIGSVLNAGITDLGFDRGHRTLSLTRKGGNPDRVALPPSVGDAIDRMLAERGQPAEGLLFALSGRPVYVAWVWRRLKRLAKAAGIPQFDAVSAHSLRATAITELLNAGRSLREVQDFARHKDPRTTRRYDKNRGDLDDAGSYVLATRYGVRRDA